MSIYAIGDLHLSLAKDKPMSIFGENWKEHEQKIKKNWLEKVKENDYVILLGDFSWATYLEEAYDDFKYLDELPGKKILLKGNHDYWWTTVTNMKNYLKENNFEKIGILTEENAMRMHNTTLTANPPFSYLTKESEKAMNDIIELRGKGEKCYFTMDAGPNVKVLCLEKDLERLTEIFEKKYKVISSKAKVVTDENN